MKKTLTESEYETAIQLWERTYEPNISNEDSLDCLDQIQAMFYSNPERKLRELRAKRSNSVASTKPTWDRVETSTELHQPESHLRSQAEQEEIREAIASWDEKHGPTEEELDAFSRRWPDHLIALDHIAWLKERA